jgi:WD40 repeat protein
MPRLLWAALLLLPTAARADAGRTTPGLVIETGARHAQADGISFSPDGKELFAWGEDKVIRRWEVNRDGFVRRVPGLRWPIMREQRGSVFTLAHSPDGKKVAIGGFGIKVGLIALLDVDATPGRAGSVIEDMPDGSDVNWSVAFSPDGKTAVYGNEKGFIYRWRPGERTTTQFAGTGGKDRNRVRLVAFTRRDSFISVAMDGVVRRWNAADPANKAVEVARFKVPNVFRAAISPDGRWLAAAGQTLKGTNEEKDALGAVELIDLRAATPAPKRIHAPHGKSTHRAVRCLAFDGRSRLLAVGCQDVPASLKPNDFFRVLGGTVLLHDITAGKWKEAIIPLTYRADAIAFNPKHPGMLATAGGDNHELRLWDVSTMKPLRGIVRSPGACIWNVGFSKDGKHFAWKDQRAARPTGRNDWGTGPWRVFDIARHDIRPAPRGFTPVLAVMEFGGWSISPTAAGVWEVAGPAGARLALRGGDGSEYNSDVNQEPQCWTFIPPSGKGVPLRLAVGHQWGVSLYELSGKPRLTAVMSGHEGQVMAVAPSADGRLLISAGRDQTICCWSLAPWKAGNEMGARFAVERGKLVVKAVDAGSPAWEALNPLRGKREYDSISDEHCALKPGDVIELLLVKNRSFVYDPAGLYSSEVRKRNVARITDKPSKSPEAALTQLTAIRPHQEYILGKRMGGAGPVIYKNTTVKRQPLWRFFPTREAMGNEWVLWRPRDFYYDTSTSGDQYVGWHVNDADPAVMPDFHPLERYRGTGRLGKNGFPDGFHRKDRVWPHLLDPSPPVDRFVFPEMEAASVRVDVVKPASASADLQVEVSARPLDPKKPRQQLVRVVLCINETEVPSPELKPGPIRRVRVTIPRSHLRRGQNTVIVRVFNEAGGRGEGTAVTDFTPPGKAKPTLHALCVGINKYNSDELVDLLCPRTDAAEMAELLRQHERCGEFDRADVLPAIPEAEITARRILAELKKLAGRAKPDDWLVVYLSGHGAVEFAKEAGGRLVKGPDGKPLPVPGSYFYPCRGYDPKKPATRLTSRDLFAALARADCRKLIILDTCHSGAATLIPSDVARDVSRDGMRFCVISSCQPDKEALEPRVPGGKFRNGFFTHALLELLTRPSMSAVGRRLEGVSFTALRGRLPEGLARTLVEFDKGFAPGGKLESSAYSPVFLLPAPATDAVLHRHVAR